MNKTPVAKAAAQAAATQKEPFVAFPVSLVNAIASYMAKRPWEEANPLLGAIEKFGVGVPAEKIEAFAAEAGAATSAKQ